MLTSTWSENYCLAARKKAENGPVQINTDFLDSNCGMNTIYPNLYVTDSSYAGIFLFWGPTSLCGLASSTLKMM